MLTTQEKYLAEQALFHGFIPRMMGTRFNMLLAGIGQTEAGYLWHAVTERLEELEQVFDRFNPSSEVTRINNTPVGQEIYLDSDLYEAIRPCTTTTKVTDSLTSCSLIPVQYISADDRTNISFVRRRRGSLSISEALPKDMP